MMKHYNSVFILSLFMIHKHKKHHFNRSLTDSFSSYTKQNVYKTI